MLSGQLLNDNVIYAVIKLTESYNTLGFEDTKQKIQENQRRINT